jgi:DNA-binding CsgD family transcriptional regulator
MTPNTPPQSDDDSRLGYCPYEPHNRDCRRPQYAEQPLPAPVAVPAADARSSRSSPIIVSDNFTDDPLLRRLEEALRSLPPAEADRRAPPDAARSAASALAPREREVISLAAQGQRNEQIAEVLRLRVITVGKTLSRVYRKLGAQNRAEAVRLWLQNKP